MENEIVVNSDLQRLHLTINEHIRLFNAGTINERNFDDYVHGMGWCSHEGTNSYDHSADFQYDSTHISNKS